MSGIMPPEANSENRLAVTRDRIEILYADPADAAARSCLSAYFQLLVERIPGVTHAHVPDPDPDADSYRPPTGAFLIARADGMPVACVGLKPFDATTAEVKRLWVDPAARGLGVARRMMDTVETAARAQGRTRLLLDTNENLHEAIALYRATGWHDIAPYSPFPATHWFEKTLSPISRRVR